MDAAQQLVDLLTAESGAEVALAGPVESIGAGFDAEIIVVQLTGEALDPRWQQPLIMRIKSSADLLGDAEREAAVQDWVADRGYRTPRVLRVFAPGELLDLPAQIMERVPGNNMLETFRRAPWRARRLLGKLGKLHRQLHDLDPSGFPDQRDLLQTRLTMMSETVAKTGNTALGEALAEVERWADELRSHEPVVCHGDFHPLNIVLPPGRDGESKMAVIDWTDAVPGDRHADVARTMTLFEIAAIAAESRLERSLLNTLGPIFGRWYFTAYDEDNIIDATRLARWRSIQLLFNWAHVVDIEAAASDENEETPRAAERFPPTLGPELRQRFNQSLQDLGSTS
ncbi:MAG: aminoglycoside phosphotransferase family protein [Actinomycetia bacterium]|nr:aminoglycoside phosphotransferase family protein [Actinomycetes bacterium]